MRDHVKIEIGLFVVNFNSRGFSLRVPDCVLDNGYGIGRPLGIADLHCQNVIFKLEFVMQIFIRQCTDRNSLDTFDI